MSLVTYEREHRFQCYLGTVLTYLPFTVAIVAAFRACGDTLNLDFATSNTSLSFVDVLCNFGDRINGQSRQKDVE